MPANQINWNIGDGTFTITTPDTVIHDLTQVLAAGQVRLAYERNTDLAVVVAGFGTNTFVVQPPTGPSVILDSRAAKALDRLGWNVPRVGG